MTMKHFHLAFVAVLVLLVGCFGCYRPTPYSPVPQRAFHAAPLEIEGWYRELHTQMQLCVGKRRAFDYIEWYVVSKGAMGDAIGLFSPPNRIYLDELYVMYAPVILHELEHYITEEGHDDVTGVWSNIRYNRCDPRAPKDGAAVGDTFDFLGPAHIVP